MWFCAIYAIGAVIEILAVLLDLGHFIGGYTIGGTAVNRGTWLGIAAPLVAMVALLMGATAFALKHHRPSARITFMLIWPLIIFYGVVCAIINAVPWTLGLHRRASRRVTKSGTTRLTIYKLNVTAARDARSSIGKQSGEIRDQHPNETNMKRNLLTLAAIGAIALSGFALAQGPGGGGHGCAGQGFALGNLTKSLNLTPDQQAKVQPLLDQARPQIVAIHQDAMQKTQAIRDKTMSQIRPLLTPDQQTKFDALQKARQDMRNAMQEMRAAKTQ
jgi:Spy/CpxP family protein refolding chaperone